MAHPVQARAVGATYVGAALVAARKDSLAEVLTWRAGTERRALADDPWGPHSRTGPT